MFWQTWAPPGVPAKLKEAGSTVIVTVLLPVAPLEGLTALMVYIVVVVGVAVTTEPVELLKLPLGDQVKFITSGVNW